MERESTNKSNSNNGGIVSVVKWSLAIFAILLVLSVSLGFSPLGVVELNNYFFSLFIHDARTNVGPEVSVSINSMETQGGISSEVTPVDSSNKNSSISYGGKDVSDPNFPVRIIIPKVNLDARILNPESRNLNVLNDSLLYGAVRYPDSGKLNSDKNILLFGHSSNLPVVHNQNFKVFLGLKQLAAGDEIILESKNTGYRYKVDSVRLTDADSEVVTFSNEHKLILSTCNTLGAHEARYITEAHFVGSYPITN